MLEIAQFEFRRNHGFAGGARNVASINATLPERFNPGQYPMQIFRPRLMQAADSRLEWDMHASSAHPAMPRWYLIIPRILLLTLLLTLISFALSLLLGILAVVITAYSRGLHPNMTVVYRHVALPFAAIAAAVALTGTSILEIRNYRQTKTLASVARASR